MKFKVGDNVVVIAGKDKGKTGQIMRIDKIKGRVTVEKVNIRTRHIKKTAQQAGQKIQYEAPLSASNVMIVDPKTKKRSRIAYKKLDNGKKQRIYKKSKEEIKNSENKVAAKSK